MLEGWQAIAIVILDLAFRMRQRRYREQPRGERQIEKSRNGERGKIEGGSGGVSEQKRENTTQGQSLVSEMFSKDF